jgi:hypothetical protein
MWILVASALQSLCEPGHEDVAQQLEIALRARGHEVESIRIPFDRDPDALWSQLFAYRMTNISDVGELLVATSTPCHLLRHRSKVLWLTDHYPWLEDGSAVLESLAAADRQACEEARATFVVSEDLCDRLARSSVSAARVLPQPKGSWDDIVATLTGTHRGQGST